MKLSLRKHKTEVLTGVAARTHLREHEPENYWSMAVAVCSCGWKESALHGEMAEQVAEEHRSS